MLGRLWGSPLGVPEAILAVFGLALCALGAWLGRTVDDAIVELPDV